MLACYGGLGPPRNNQQTVYASFTEAYRPFWEHAAKTTWESWAETGVTQKGFYTTHKDVLSLFGSTEDYEQVFRTDDPVKNAPDAVDRLASNSVVCESLFQSELLRVRRIVYQKKIGEALRDVIHEDFTEEAMDAFDQAMLERSRKLISGGALKFEKVAVDVQMMGEAVTVVSECPADDYKWHKMAALVACDVASGGSPSMPWEGLIFDERRIPGARETCHSIPDKIIERKRAARSQILEFLSGKEQTIATMVETLNKKDVKKALKEMDKTIDLELEFLFTHAERLLTKKIQDLALSLMPSPTTPSRRVQECIGELSKLRLHPAATAVVGMFAQIDGILDFLQNLLIGKGPKRGETTNVSDFFAAALKAAENFYELDKPGANKSKKGKQGGQQVRGAEAIKLHYDELNTAFKDWSGVAAAVWGVFNEIS